MPRIGEIIGGSQREERHDVLVERSAASLPSRPIGGTSSFANTARASCGFGLDRRMLMYLTGMKNIRDVIPFTDAGARTSGGRWTCASSGRAFQVMDGRLACGCYTVRPGRPSLGRVVSGGPKIWRSALTNRPGLRRW